MPTTFPTDRQLLFIRALAAYLANNQAGKSIALQTESRVKPVVTWAHEWRDVLTASPLWGYPTLQEAERQLIDFLRAR